jgi:hypothetical protein
MKIRKLPYRFCSKKCFGHYIGKNYGFAKHPEYCRYRKYDYGAVVKLTNDGLSPRRISEQLAIPIKSLYMIRHKLNLPKRTARKYDHDVILALHNNSKTVRQITDELNIKYLAVYGILYKLGKVGRKK